ncbi:hypothetical protein HZH66_009137 [Vespula vulgaris]|uniref:Uncharacterized protein n=1 Tax=Vespula vulgaris TaxID=7454 RepID=A0A834N364_VESVU|nr:hypothetical protein HZH66_009137 [Vespula vulgaris]
MARKEEWEEKEEKEEEEEEEEEKEDDDDDDYDDYDEEERSKRAVCSNGGGLYGGREARTTLRSSTTISISSRHQIRLVAQEPSAYSKLG